VFEPFGNIKIENEAHLVSLFCQTVRRHNEHAERTDRLIWTEYHETAGWDLLLVRSDGVQIGIEAKMTLNAKVLEQSIPYPGQKDGPDFRAVLVARTGLQLHLSRIAAHLGLTIISMSAQHGWKVDAPVQTSMSPSSLPSDHDWDLRNWFPWYPIDRCELPDYVPDVQGGKASPLTLTPWKIKAIKLMILLDRHGFVTRKDMRFLNISETIWTAWNGYLTPGPVRGQYVRSGKTPDFRAQHPTNYDQINADWENWKPKNDANP
jgi:hypothetical protein